MSHDMEDLIIFLIVVLVY